MNAADLMSGEMAVVDVATSVADAAKLMQSQNTGCLVVVERGTLAGIITERDMVLGCLIDGHTSWQCQVYRHMTILNEAANPQTDIGDALLIMMDNEVSYLPVVHDNGSVLGLLYAEDLSRAIEQDDDPIAVMDGDLISI
ncbi:MAG: CBS domain-containing protein [Chloroflexi bacterium]|nr:CBS domain-containing protein [Chloroflexota bacterium]